MVGSPCPSAEWRVIVALSRYGGLRCPSEHLALRWRDVDFENGRLTVWSSKTEGIEGREFRHVPMFPELRRELEAAFEQAADGAELVISRYRQSTCNLRTQLLRIIARAGVRPWPKLMHNLRASRQSELSARYPLADVCEWLGNSPAVAARHYLMARDCNFEAAIRTPTAESASSKPTQNPTQTASERGGQRWTAGAGSVA